MTVPLVAEVGRALDRPVPERDGLVESLVERLHAEFGVDPEEIRSHATAVLARFATARVQAFVPILVEKALRQTYRGSPRTAPQW
jgi:hypothetical protein